LEISIIQHLRRQSQDQKFSYIPGKIFIKVGKSQGHIQKRLQECPYINHLESPGSLSPTPSTSSIRKTPKNIGKDPDASESEDEGDTQVEYSSDQFYSPHIWPETKNYFYKFGSVQVQSHYPEY